jgi:dTDP-4-dehydrorhamnose reductase
VTGDRPVSRVIVTGAGGLVGGVLAARLAEAGFAVTAGQHDAPAPEHLPRVPMDLLSSGSVEAALDVSRADAVVHAAALANPDHCEADPARAEALNVRAPGALARACRRRSLRLVALSTDLVFPGDRSPLSERDAPAPILLYGRTKLAGEDAVLTEAPGSAVVRVALVYGRGHGPRGTASESIAWALAAGRPVKLFTDQYRTPIDAASVADAVARILRGHGSGRYHLGGPERVSRHTFGLRVAEALGLSPRGIVAVRQGDLAQAAVRPADVALDSTRAREELGWTPRPLDAAIREGRPAPL